MPKKSPSLRVGLPIDECMLAQTCTWAKQSKTCNKPHCRKVTGWGPGESGAGQPAALAEFRKFLNQYRTSHPHLDYRSAQKAASSAWHAQHGTVKGQRKPRLSQTGGDDTLDWDAKMDLNMKRRMAGLPPFMPEDYETRMHKKLMKSTGQNQKGGNDPIDKIYKGMVKNFDPNYIAYKVDRLNSDQLVEIVKRAVEDYRASKDPIKKITYQTIESAAKAALSKKDISAYIQLTTNPNYNI